MSQRVLGTGDVPFGESLLGALPRVVIVGAVQLEPAHAVAIGLLAAEAASGRPGQQALLDRLLDVNLVYALRAWWAQPGPTQRRGGQPPDINSHMS